MRTLLHYLHFIQVTNPFIKDLLFRVFLTVYAAEENPSVTINNCWSKEKMESRPKLLSAATVPQCRSRFRTWIQENTLHSFVLVAIHIIADKRRLQICNWNIRLSDERSHISERVVIWVVVVFYVIFHRTREGDITNEQQGDLLWEKRKKVTLFLNILNSCFLTNWSFPRRNIPTLCLISIF